MRRCQTLGVACRFTGTPNSNSWRIRPTDLPDPEEGHFRAAGSPGQLLGVAPAEPKFPVCAPFTAAAGCFLPSTSVRRPGTMIGYQSVRLVGTDEKGKPIARWGRKVTGLSELAGLPNRMTSAGPHRQLPAPRESGWKGSCRHEERDDKSARPTFGAPSWPFPCRHGFSSTSDRCDRVRYDGSSRCACRRMVLAASVGLSGALGFATTRLCETAVRR
jgi:hypothetical protein